MHTTAYRKDHLELPGNTDGNAEFHRQASLLKTGALQGAIFNSANFSCIATDERGVIQIFNVGAERMLGYLALDVLNRITPADISDPQEIIARATSLSVELDTPITAGFEALVFKASRGIEDIYELTYVRKDGSRFPAIVSVTALRDARDGIIGYLLIGTDNTARKQVEAAQAVLDQRLRDQQFYTRSLIESNIDALMMTDPAGIISDVNQQMIALTGRTRDELIGAPSKNFFTEPALAEAAIKRVLTEDKVSDYELTVRARNGVETVVSYNAATFHDRDRKLQGVFAAARDVTERKRFERALEAKNIELEHASRMKTEFLATMSHELRTPLNAIIGFSEALKDGLMGETTALQHESIDDIFASGQHLLSLINDILDLSKVEAGKMALELEAVDFHQLLSNSLTIVRETAAAQQINLELDIGDGLDMLQLDMRKTKQIVYNLLSNAVKFSTPGGEVKLRARTVVRGMVGMLPGTWPVHRFPHVDNEFNDFVEICVSDHGIGISQNDMPRLFRAFSQIDSGLARKFEGTGLGLAMVRQLAELQGGAVAVASAERQGARFAVWLRIRAPSPVQPRAPRPAHAAPTHYRKYMAKILVIEDNAANMRLASLLLRNARHEVLCAVDAELGLAMARSAAPDLILMDIQLPGMDGLAATALLKQDPHTAAIPVIALTALAMKEDQEKSQIAGCDAYIAKPLCYRDLYAAIDALLPDQVAR